MATLGQSVTAKSASFICHVLHAL